MRILVTDGMDKTAMAELKAQGHEVVEQFYEPAELGKALRDFDVVVVRSKTKVRAAQIDEAKGSQLKLIIRGGVGVDNIDVDYAKAAGIDAHGYVADVSDEDAVNTMVAKIKAEVGPVDILVNNAGIIRRVPMHEMEAADFRRVIDIDLNAPFIVSKAVLPAMMKKGHGKIINICSMMSE